MVIIHYNANMLLLILTILTHSVSPFVPTVGSPSMGGLKSSSLQNDLPTDDDELNMDAFKARKRQQEEVNERDSEEEFDGYALRDVIYEKWGKCYDVDFNRVDSFGFRNLYLNILPFHLGARRFRHETELDYLCHLQAVVEILEKYGQVRHRPYQPLKHCLKERRCLTIFCKDWICSSSNR